MLSSSKKGSLKLQKSNPSHKNVEPKAFRPYLRLFRSENAKGYLFISPWLFGFIFLSLIPLITTVYNSFTNYNLYKPGQWVGITNYQQILFEDEIFSKVVFNMMIYVSASTSLTIGGGFLFAVLLNRRFPGNHFFRVIIYVPSLLVGVATGVLFKQVFNGGEFGLANQFLGLFSINPVKWLSDFDRLWLGLLALILINIWFVGGTMLIFLAGLKGISPTYYEAAKIDGAGPIRSLWFITLPLLSPVIVFNTILTLIGHIQVFETPFAFFANSFSGVNSSSPLGYRDSLGTFLTYLYTKAFIYREFGYASALAIIIFFLTLAFTLLILWFAGRFTFYGEVVKN